MYDTTDFRKNLKIEIDGEPFVIIDCQHVKPGKGVAFVKTKYKSLISGRVLEQNFRSGDKVQRPNLEAREVEYIYQDPPFFVFMDQTTWEEIRLNEEAIAEIKDYLIDNLRLDVLLFNGSPISVEPPTFVELTVAQTDPGFKGDTAQGGTKPATLETGAVIQVPLYLEQGELVKVDTRTGAFVERVKQ
jgi:elongation factor P